MPFGGMRFYGLSSREAVMTDCGCELEGENDAQRKTLRVVLAINTAIIKSGSWDPSNRTKMPETMTPMFAMTSFAEKI